MCSSGLAPSARENLHSLDDEWPNEGGLELRAGTAVLAFVLLSAALATAIPAVPASEASGPADLSSYLILLRDQQSHAASLDVRAATEPALTAIADRRAALVFTPDDLGRPDVLDLNRQIDVRMGEVRLAIASEAFRRHAATRSAVETIIEELGGTVHYRSPLLNLLGVWLPDSAVATLLASPLIASVEPDATMDVQLDVSVPSISASSFWTGGFTGGPYKIVVPDTGVDSTHPALAGKISDADVFHDVAQIQGNYNDNPASPDDLHGHGTHIAGIVASQDATDRGVAHGMLGVVNVKFGYLTTGGGGQGVWSDAMMGIDWSIFTAGGDVLTFSYGGGSNNDGTDAMSRFMDALVDDLGIPVSAAAGNNGAASSIIQPATAYNIVTVGAMDDRNSVSRADDGIAGFSSRGPTGDGRIKPDIAAPGNAITSTAHDWEGGGNDWVGMSGTSMASPHVGASLILYLNAAGGPPMFPARSKAVLLNTATDWGAGGPDNTYGWGYLDLAAAWARRNNVVQDDADEGVPQFFKLAGAANDRATMVWQKHVVYNGISAPLTSNSLNNLELRLYNEFANSLLDSSLSVRDNVEQVEFAAAAPGVVKVTVNGALGSLVSVEPFALAGVAPPIPANAPALAPTVIAPPTVNQGDTFVVSVNVANPGGLRVFGTNVQLNIPPGLILVAGANPAGVGTIVEGTFASASWTLSAPFAGTHVLTAGASGNAYGETYGGTSPPTAVLVADTAPPTIAGPSAVPSPQNPGGIVNISASIFDNLAVAGSWVEVWDPVGGSVGNFTMTFDTITGRRYYFQTYVTLGDYAYTITAEDTSGLTATASGLFRIQDMIAPTISGAAATPDPQEVFFSVNVTATATDNVGVIGTYVEITDPLGGWFNVTMDRAGSAIWFAQTYNLLGTHSYMISVHDAAMHWATAVGTFLVRDATAPLADAGPDRSVELGLPFVFDGTGSSDNVGIVSYAWDFLDGGSPVTLTGATASYMFLNLGTVFATLTVRDASGNSGTDMVTVLVVDPTPPEITDVRTDPPLQDVGLSVAVSARVWDRFGVAGVSLRVQDPTGSVLNVSMPAAGSRHELALPYATKGVHIFQIWAVDTSGNWNSTSGAFVIADLSPPAVSMTATPDPQDIFGTIEVAATVTDNDMLANVWAEVRDPSGLVAAILPMTPQGGQWTATFTPAVLGPHRTTVWATDVSGNLGFDLRTVWSVDRTPPTLLVDAPLTAEVLTTFTTTVTVADDLGSYVATMEARDLSGVSAGNRSLVLPSPVAVLWRFDALGEHPWVAWAVDPSGNSVVIEGMIDVVDSQPPIADAGPDRTIVQGTTVPLDASGSTDNYGIATYTWTFVANGGTRVLSDEHAAFEFRQAGSVVVTLIVEDLAGNLGTDTASIRVVAADRDGDGASDDDEVTDHTDPTLPDTDGDGILDGADSGPTSPEINVIRWFTSWFGILVLLAILGAILVVGGRRKREEPESPTAPAQAAAPQAVRFPSVPAFDLPPPPPDEGLPPPPDD